jgi:hypothetical protein
MRDNYGGGHASGRVVRDTVNVAGLAATNFTFGVIDHLDLEGSTLKAWDGILGLTFDNISPDRPPTFLAALLKQGVLKHRIMTFLLLDTTVADPGAFEAISKDATAMQSMLELGGMTMVPTDKDTKGSKVNWVPLIRPHSPSWLVGIRRFTLLHETVRSLEGGGVAQCRRLGWSRGPPGIAVEVPPRLQVGSRKDYVWGEKICGNSSHVNASCFACADTGTVRARPGWLSSLSVFHIKMALVWRFRMGVQGA